MEGTRNCHQYSLSKGEGAPLSEGSENEQE